MDKPWFEGEAPLVIENEIAGEYEPLNRRITGDEYDKALEIAREAGLRRFEL